MAKFDFIESASEGYKFVWERRKILLPLAAIPYVIKLILLGVIVAFGIEQNYLRQGLILLPYYAAQGWFLAVIVRMAIWGDHTVSLKATDHDPAPVEAIRALRAGIGVFVLLKLFGAVVTGFAISHGLADTMQGQPVNAEGSLFALGAAAFLLVFTIWAFRLLWLYVPAALGYSMRGYLRAMKGMTSSFQLIALWLLCFVPLFVVMMMGLEFLNGLLPSVNIAEERGSFTSLLVSSITSIVEITVDAIAAIAVAFAVHSMMRTDKA